MTMGGALLEGLSVVSFESRHADAMGELIRHHGATAILAPSMREVPLEENHAAFDFHRRLEAREIDVVVLLTGGGTRALVKVLSSVCDAPRLADLLRSTVIVVRGPKPVKALREIGLTPNVEVPEPNTWRDVLTTIDQRLPVAGLRVAVQEYGLPNEALLAGLAERGAQVVPVPVYRWALPQDLGPLRDAVRRIADGSVDVALFTSARQCEHAIQVAASLGLRESFVAAGRRMVVASVGPVCSEAVRSHGLPVDLEPDHPKMGQHVHLVAQRSGALLRQKRGLDAEPPLA